MLSGLLGQRCRAFDPRLIQGDKYENLYCKFRPAVCYPVTLGLGLFPCCCNRSRAQLGNMGLAAGHLACLLRLVKNKPIYRDGSDAVRRGLSERRCRQRYPFGPSASCRLFMCVRVATITLGAFRFFDIKEISTIPCAFCLQLAHYHACRAKAPLIKIVLSRS